MANFQRTLQPLFAYLGKHPTSKCITNIPACSSQNKPFQQHITWQYQKMNGNTLKQICQCNPFNSFITSKIHVIPLQGWSWACHTNNPLGVEIVTILVPFYFWVQLMGFTINYTFINACVLKYYAMMFSKNYFRMIYSYSNQTMLRLL